MREKVNPTREHWHRSIAVLPDVNGNGKAEIAYLGEAPVGTFRLQIKDAATGELIVGTFLE